jgi:hypothetical protein
VEVALPGAPRPRCPCGLETVGAPLAGEWRYLPAAVGYLTAAKRRGGRAGQFNADYASDTRPMIKSMMGLPGAKDPVRDDMTCP